ncbi:leucine zipper putative tumor suppressor 2 homolog [Drosophila ananassae]|uniref:leucine zipper putative tumor suppressor 2 homolog n=1 Tax=Drosophila ananassae TaxID=7217 RepID=UPI0013A5D317|nr:leucine zipper putative tumor suppressor 2 homolog [Drosophila ananassae]
MSAATHMALPAHAVDPPPGTPPVAVNAGSACSSLTLPAGRRGHKRSVSLENNAPLALRSTPNLGQSSLGSPLLHFSQGTPGQGQPFHTGTLKSRQEQRRLSQKFGSHSNLDDEGVGGGVGAQMRSKFQNIRQMFELSRSCVVGGSGGGSGSGASTSGPTAEEEGLQSLPAMLSQQPQPLRRTTPIAGGSRHHQGEAEQNGNFLRPIAFKPIPFEPDYRIACQQQQQKLQLQQQQQQLPQQAAGQVGERYGYGSTPSLAPLPAVSQKFGSTTDLRHLAARRRNHRILQRSGNEDALSLDLLGSGSHDRPDGASSKSSGTVVGSSDLTPSPSDSGISELEAALKDRDSELSYLRQAVEHNTKDKEANWEQDNQRLRLFYEGQQRESQLKLRKMEQLLGLQQFQLKQHKLRQSEHVGRLQQQLDHAHCTSQQLQQQLEALRTQLEDSEWRVCERNGEIALLKTQLKEAHLEINAKDHAIVSLKHNRVGGSSSSDPTTSQSQPKQPASEGQKQQQLKSSLALDTQQLQKIITLKDQVIGALTSELAKLRKELSDLAIAHEYGEEPCGRYTRLKQQLDNLNEICQKTRSCTTSSPAPAPKELPKLDVLVQGLQIDPGHGGKSHQPLQPLQPPQQTLDTLIEESTTYAEDIAKLRQKLDDFRLNLELEKRQWSAEKDKVLGYQKQLQAHYIHMYQKLRCLDSQVEAGAPNEEGKGGGQRAKAANGH